MLYAVTIDPLKAIFFLDERPEENGWHVQEGVELDLPFNYDSWPEGDAPDREPLGATDEAVNAIKRRA